MMPAEGAPPQATPGSRYKYIVCGVCISSNVPLPELIPAAGQPKCSVQLDVDSSFVVPAELDSVGWQHLRGQDGSPWLSMRQLDANQSLLRFARIADFVVDYERGRIRCSPFPDASIALVHHALFDHVMPRVLAALGHIALHGSAVMLPGGAIGLVGVSGSGKSTLAAALTRRDSPALTDDCLAVTFDGTKHTVFPSYPTLRLWPDSARHLFNQEETNSGEGFKLRLGCGEGPVFEQARGVALQRIYLLGDPLEAGNNIFVERLRPREALLKLLEHKWLVETMGPEQRMAEFEAFSLFAGNVPVFRLSYPHDYAQLPAVLDVIEKVDV